PAFTMGVGAGMYVNPALFGTFKPLFPGIQYEPPWLTFWIIGMGIYVLCAWLMIYINLRRLGVRHAASVDMAEQAPPARKRTPYYTYVVPLFPVLMIMVFKWQIIPTFLLSIVLALLLTWKDRPLQGHLNLFNKSFYDAFPDIATIAALWIICGMIIAAGQTPQVSAALKPIFGPILPHTTLQAAIFFAVLAPLAIYRGPFSVVGTGAALLAVMLNADYVSPIFLYPCWRGPLCLQGSQDPTNSWTLWTIGYTKVSHAEFLRTALPWGWLMVAVNAFIA